MELHRDLAAFLAVGLLVGASVVQAPPSALASPTNDDFASAAPLTGDSWSGSNLDATTETDEPGGTDATLWWLWTAPATGDYLFDTCGSAIPTDVTVYTGSTLATLTEESTFGGWCGYEGGWAYSNEQVMLTGATLGTSYYVQVGSLGGGMGDVTLRWWPAEIPTNDDVGAARPLTGDTGRTTGTTRFATAGADDGLYGSPSVWFSWTPSTPGSYVLDTCGSNFNTYLAAYTSTEEGYSVDTANDDVCMRQSAITLEVTEVQPYFIAVAGAGPEDFGDFVLHWRAEAAPENDDFARAEPISGASGSAEGNGVFATTEPGEPAIGSASTWWRRTAPADGLVMFETCDSDFETELAAYTGADVASLTTVADGYSYCFGQAMLMFEATSGTPYYLQVAGPATSGAFDILLRWKMGEAPANDDFADAAPLSGAGGTLHASTEFATTEVGEPTGGRQHTVWWTWLAPADGWVSFDTCGSSVGDTTLGVYIGDAVGSLAGPGLSVGNGCGGIAAEATIYATAGTLYHVVIGSDAMADVVLHWPASGVESAPVVSVDPPDRSVMAGETARFSAEATGFPTPTVRWQELSTDLGADWTDIGGETSNTLDVPTTYAMDGYRYRAVFTNTVGSTESAAATLTVAPRPPSVTVDPSDQLVDAGTVASFSSAASGDPEPTVQWQVLSTAIGADWTDIGGATTTTLEVPTTYLMHGYQYRAVFTNTADSATTRAATLSVTPDVGVGNLVATVAKGKVTVTFDPVGDPAPTYFQCQFTGKGSKGGWVACTDGEVFKLSARTVEVHAGYSPTGPWGDSVFADLTRAK